MILTPTWLMWPLLIAHLAALKIEGLTLSLLRRDAMLWRQVYWPALMTPFREWSMLHALRREVQATRMISLEKWCSVVRWQLRKVAMLARYGVPKVT